MGKRSSFERIEKDYYPTIDKRAVEALLPVLIETDGVYYDSTVSEDKTVKYIEPCSGQGHLVDQLSEKGLVCVGATDIETGKDALSYTSQEANHADCFITNPPWSRHILHPMIEHLSALLPTWLLFDADWAHTKQSSVLMKERCTHIVSVGRLIWIPGTTMTGKDNCAWYRFDINKQQDTIFHGRN
jgi:hypothetical protein